MRAARCALWYLVTTGACLDSTPMRSVARVSVSAPDTAALVGQTIVLAVTAFDRAGDVLAAPLLFWESLDTTRARVDTTGRVVLGPASGDVLVTATTRDARIADTISLHAAVEG